jgi:hypothetical protein
MTKTSKSSFAKKFGVPVHFAVAPAISVSATDDAADVTVALHSTLQKLVDDLQVSYPIDGTGQSWQPAHLGGTAPTPAEAAAVEAARQARKKAERAAASTKG